MPRTFQFILALLLALALLGWGASLLGLGTCLFAGDLASRAIQGHALFPYAAPAGGGAMILAWAWLALAFLAG